jgi:hypothetical protein
VDTAKTRLARHAMPRPLRNTDRFGVADAAVPFTGMALSAVWLSESRGLPGVYGCPGTPPPGPPVWTAAHPARGGRRPFVPVTWPDVPVGSVRACQWAQVRRPRRALRCPHLTRQRLRVGPGP